MRIVRLISLKFFSTALTGHSSNKGAIVMIFKTLNLSCGEKPTIFSGRRCSNSLGLIPVLVIVALLVGVCGPATANTPVSGPVSGTWNVAGSPYIVIDNVSVPTGQTLVVEAGVTVLVAEGMEILVDGTADFQGEPGSPVTLRAAAAGTTWLGVLVRLVGHGNVPTTSQFAYCQFSDAEQALHLYVQGQVDNQLTTMTTEIVGCTFDSSNAIGIHAEAYGYNISYPAPRRRSASVDPVIRRCIFDGCAIGIQVYPHGSCASWCGSGNSQSLVENCVFMDASDAAFKILPASYNSASTKIYNNTILRCENGVVLPDPYDGQVVNNVFQGCGTALQRTAAPLSGYVHYNCFYENSVDFLNYPASGYGTPILVNQHGDPMDLALNVLANPELDGYHISTMYSACVDAGVDTLGTLMDIDNEDRIRGRNTDIGADETDFYGVLVVSSVDDEDGRIPVHLATLHAAVPNPFNPSTELSFEMAAAGHARLMVYDTAGRLVVTLVNERRDAGLHEVIWDGRDHAGRMSSAGVYLYSLEAGGYVETKRMTLVK